MYRRIFFTMYGNVLKKLLGKSFGQAREPTGHASSRLSSGRIKDRTRETAEIEPRGGEERKETLADKPRDFENHPHWSVTPEFVNRHLMLSSTVIIDQ